jgi:hypothetical protein
MDALDVLDSANVNSISTHNERAPAGLLLVAFSTGARQLRPDHPPTSTGDLRCDVFWVAFYGRGLAIAALRGAADGPSPAKFCQAAVALMSSAALMT